MELACDTVMNDGDKITHEHIYCDQASFLVQVGLTVPEKLPAVGIAQARRLPELSGKRTPWESARRDAATLGSAMGWKTDLLFRASELWSRGTECSDLRRSEPVFQPSRIGSN
jgi:hypothetical protein